MIESLVQLQPVLSDVDNRVRRLANDPEADLLSATVAGLRTRHATLQSQANRYKQTAKVGSLHIHDTTMGLFD